MHRQTCILSVCLVASLCTAAASGQNVLYGSDVSLDELGSIDRTNGAWATIGNQQINGAITGLAYDPNTNNLYGCSPNNNSLYMVDQSTGVVTLVGATGFSDINCLAFDPNNNVMYCIAVGGGNILFTIDLATGAGTAVGAISGASNLQGLAYDPASDTLYGLDNTVDTVVIINATTAVATALPNVITSSPWWRGLTWDSQLGVLWATTIVSGSLHCIDPTTGISTFVGTPQNFVHGLAFKGGAGSANYEVNKPGASFDINGIQGTASSFATVVILAGQVATANFASTNTGQAWEIAVGIAPLLPASAGAPVIGGQLLNLNPGDPTLFLVWNGFLSPAFANFSAPLSFATPTSLSLQMAVISPAGISLSQPVRLIVQ